MSTSTLGGHVNATIPEQADNGRRRRRLHSDEFKANAVASCVPGMSMAAVAMVNGINANLLRRWVHEAEARQEGKRPLALATPKPAARGATASFVPVELPVQSAAADIRPGGHACRC